MSESPTTRRFCRSFESKQVGGLTYPLVASQYAPPGWPDRRFEHLRWCGYIEFKALNGTLKAIQRRMIREIKARGTDALVGRFDASECWIRFEDEDGGLISDWMTWGRAIEWLLSRGRK